MTIIVSAFSLSALLCWVFWRWIKSGTTIVISSAHEEDLAHKAFIIHTSDKAMRRMMEEKRKREDQ